MAHNMAHNRRTPTGPGPNLVTMTAPADLTRLGLAECREVLAGTEKLVGDHSAMWAALREAEFQRSGPASNLLGRVNHLFVDDFRRRREDVSPRHPFFTGTLDNGIRYLGDARDWPSALHAVDPGCNSLLIDALGRELARRPGNYVDVGTNIGVVASSMATQLGTRGKVFAFEPSPDTMRLAASTVALNGLDNVTLFNAAVSDSDGELVFQTTPGNSAIASPRRHNFGLLNEWQEVTVPAVRLDTLHAAGELEGVTLLKIDVEGHELSVLQGATGFIGAALPTVVYEYTPVAARDNGWSEQDSMALISGAGDYEFTALGEGDGRWVTFPLPEGYTDQVNVVARPRDLPAGDTRQARGRWRRRGR
jgi:FkbM family methyltransferase